MARNSDNTHRATKKQPQSCVSTLETDSCSSSSVVDWVVHNQQPTSAPFTRPFRPKNESFPEEYNDSGVALSSSKALSDRESCQVLLYKKDFPQTCEEQLLIDKKLASLQIRRSPTDFSVPAEAGHDPNSDDVRSEALFNWDFIFQQDQDGDT